MLPVPDGMWQMSAVALPAAINQTLGLLATLCGTCWLPVIYAATYNSINCELFCGRSGKTCHSQPATKEAYDEKPDPMSKVAHGVSPAVSLTGDSDLDSDSVACCE